MSAAMPEPTPAAPSDDLEQKVVGALKKIYDPEIPVNIHDLGLIYSVNVADGGAVQVTMTLTAPACPVAGTLPGEVERAVRSVDGVSEAKVELVWDPPWNPGMMSKMARVMLGM
ncbi:MAG: SUF system Fe-S cluster assembly protein [Holophagales bacterium]|nr:SUF system Fe-S cluster assembly protein [Holophagales bacterium]MBK9965848.1 SUF system Fe-S cluster assembly protein [Holophagales bacterium]